MSERFIDDKFYNEYKKARAYLPPPPPGMIRVKTSNISPDNYSPRALRSETRVGVEWPRCVVVYIYVAVKYGRKQKFPF